MKKVLVFQHVAHEILGTLHPLLRQEGFRIRYANFGRGDHPDLNVESYDGLVILGGPMGVYEADKHRHLADEIRAIQDAIARDKPVLGICLGAQLIAAALGAKVEKGPTKEIGWYDVSLTEDGAKDPVLGCLSPTEKIFQWHQDFFELPKDAVWLATSPACKYQAFRYGANVYGFQFHLEVDEPMIERWLRLSAHAELFRSEFSADAIRASTHTHVSRLKELSAKVFTSYLTSCRTKRRTILLGSR